jgi:hypothetical protein
MHNFAIPKRKINAGGCLEDLYLLNKLAELVEEFGHVIAAKSLQKQTPFKLLGRFIY